MYRGSERTICLDLSRQSIRAQHNRELESLSHPYCLAAEQSILIDVTLDEGSKCKYNTALESLNRYELCALVEGPDRFSQEKLPT